MAGNRPTDDEQTLDQDDLEFESDAPFAIRMATRRDRRSAETVARFVETETWPAEVARWEFLGEEYFDIYLVGMRSLEEASAVAREATRGGWLGELEILTAPRRLDEEYE